MNENVLLIETQLIIKTCEKLNIMNMMDYSNELASSLKANKDDIADIIIQDSIINMLMKENKIRTAEFMEYLNSAIQHNAFYDILIKVKGMNVAIRTKDRISRKILSTLVEEGEEKNIQSFSKYINSTIRNQLRFAIDIIEKTEKI